MTTTARANPYAPATTPLPPITVTGRLDRLRDGFDEHEVDALVVTTLANIRYLTGFSGSAGVLDGHPRRRAAHHGRSLSDPVGRADRAGRRGAQVEIAIGPVAEQRAAAQLLLGGDRTSTGSGSRPTTSRGTRSCTWADLVGGERLVPTSNAVEALRARKDEAEIARMERAAAIADAALFEVLPLMGQGVTEEHFALELDTAMRRGGAESTAFETIVAAGENSAKPHHHPGGRRINHGDPVVVDFGATFEGYRSDMTRTFCVDAEPEGELARIFEVVRTSQAAGAEAVRPGISAKEVDDVCRQIIAEAGWAERFEHGTGHGVGLDIHEAPTVSQLGTAILAPGFVVTVEPGVYVPGHGGVRVEDTLVVTEDGARPLTRFTKDIHGSLDQ